MSAHTPGPWVYDREHSFVGSESPEAGPADMVCLPPDPWCKRSREFWPANARLIAAAPDLLEALRSLVPQSERVQGPDLQTLEMAKAAIFKATGAAA